MLGVYYLYVSSRSKYQDRKDSHDRDETNLGWDRKRFALLVIRVLDKKGDNLHIS